MRFDCWERFLSAAKILAENCHLAKICVYNIVPIKNFGTANNKDRCSLSKEDKDMEDIDDIL